jgi:transcriptional regulator with XRE-family HTH domain
MAKRLTADGTALRRIREDAWLDRKELAEITGLSEHTIMRIELGTTPHPFRSTVRSLAKALGVHPDELVVKEDESESSSGPLGHVRRRWGPARIWAPLGIG